MSHGVTQTSEIVGAQVDLGLTASQNSQPYVLEKLLRSESTIAKRGIMSIAFEWNSLNLFGLENRNTALGKNNLVKQQIREDKGVEADAYLNNTKAKAVEYGEDSFKFFAISQEFMGKPLTKDEILTRWGFFRMYYWGSHNVDPRETRKTLLNRVARKLGSVPLRKYHYPEHLTYEFPG